MNLISVHEYFLVERVRKMVLLSESTRGNLVQVKIQKKKKKNQFKHKIIFFPVSLVEHKTKLSRAALASIMYIVLSNLLRVALL